MRIVVDGPHRRNSNRQYNLDKHTLRHLRLRNRTQYDRFQNQDGHSSLLRTHLHVDPHLIRLRVHRWMKTLILQGRPRNLMLRRRWDWG